MATNKKAYSKINLILKVYRSLRQETKHRILGLFCLHKEIYDEIDIKPSKKLLIKYFVNNKNVIIDNCSIKNSITYMKNKHGIDTNLNIRVQKNIPLMSGIGGSASDAAYVIKWLCNKHKIPLDKLDTKDIALTLGSDIPFFLSSYSAALVSGYGETIKLWNKKLPKYKLTLVAQQLPTVKVFKLLSNDKIYVSKVNFNQCYQSLINGKQYKQLVYNDLQKYAFRLKPKLQTIYNCKQQEGLLCFISGSGGSIIQIGENK